jgi:quercetin dioxygenase-like cupin family protein
MSKIRKFPVRFRLLTAAASLGLAVLLSGAFLAERALATPEPIVRELMTKALPNSPGKVALMLAVTYPPGSVDPIHRHDAHGFIYVLEGSIVMGVNGGKEVTLTPGQTFYEGPNDIHSVGRNASATKPARFLVLLIKEKGVPAVLPVR